MADQATEKELAPERVSDVADAQLVDVRTAEEVAAGRVPGARHIPLEQVQDRAGELVRERPVVFYCRSGERSALAADAFRASGWDAYSITGGLVAWAEKGLPLEPEDGEVAHHSGLPPA